MRNDLVGAIKVEDGSFSHGWMKDDNLTPNASEYIAKNFLPCSSLIFFEIILTKAVLEEIIKNYCSTRTMRRQETKSIEARNQRNANVTDLRFHCKCFIVYCSKLGLNFVERLVRRGASPDCEELRLAVHRTVDETKHRIAILSNKYVNTYVTSTHTLSAFAQNWGFPNQGFRWLKVGPFPPHHF